MSQEKRASIARSAFLAACVALFLLPAAGLVARETDIGLSVVMGMAIDQETGEEMPVRPTAGIALTVGPLTLTALADCGLPWEPAVRIDGELAALDLDLLRAVLLAGSWVRCYGSYATEVGIRFGLRAEIGPRLCAFVGAVGASPRSTHFNAIGGSLPDTNYWARVGIVVRPLAPARFGLDITTDAPLSLWCRTSFELNGSWELPGGVRVEGLFALRYSDFFTLTAYIDGFEARALFSVPLPRSGQ